MRCRAILNFEKRASLRSDLFSKSLALDLLLGKSRLNTEENGRRKNELLQIAKITFPSSVFRHCIFGNTEHGTRNTRGGVVVPPLVFNPVFYRFAVSRNAILNIFRLRQLRYHKVPETSPCG